MKFSKNRILPYITAASISVFFACGNDSSSSPNSENVEPVPGSSATVSDSTNTPDNPPLSSESSVETSSETTPVDQSSSAEQADPGIVESSSSIADAPASSTSKFLREPTEEEIAEERIYTANSATADFQDLPTVYKNLDPTDKVAFVIRHAQREKSTGVESQLTEKGIEQSKTLGTYLVSDEDFAYGSTNFVRTRATAQYISEGRGQEFPEPIVLPELVASTFVADEEKFKALMTEAGYIDEAYMYSEWAYDGKYTEAFNDFEKTGVQIITQAILPRMSTEKRVNIFISHDMFLGPFIAYCTNKETKVLRKHAITTENCTDCRWIQYLEGIAIIVKADGTRKYVPVSGNMLNKK
ncbi:histidine phosphatase family protein [uncultured Fibrobacter sp.]|uniref:histidine phosphatase family protein n=1 Tax=uncultured Fibrobacter sp. TaxID=261512 RepID=UPI0026305FBC|nr:histidine phosphatase family protein [uncultured Fibrobacter sp.]